MSYPVELTTLGPAGARTYPAVLSSSALEADRARRLRKSENLYKTSILTLAGLETVLSITGCIILLIDWSTISELVTVAWLEIGFSLVWIAILAPAVLRGIYCLLIFCLNIEIMAAAASFLFWIRFVRASAYYGSLLSVGCILLTSIRIAEVYSLTRLIDLADRN